MSSVLHLVLCGTIMYAAEFLGRPHMVEVFFKYLLIKQLITIVWFLRIVKNDIVSNIVKCVYNCVKNMYSVLIMFLTLWVGVLF